MYKYAIYCINGFKGSGYYDTHGDALTAARNRTALSDIPWYVAAIKVG